VYEECRFDGLTLLRPVHFFLQSQTLAVEEDDDGNEHNDQHDDERDEKALCGNGKQCHGG